MDDPELLDLFRRQHGLISRSQAVARSVDPDRIDRRLSSARWEQIAPGVYGVPGHRHSWLRSLWAAHLHAGPESAMSHESAGRLRGFPQVPANRVVLIVADRRRHAPPGITWHRLVDLDPGDVDPMDGLPVTTPARTIVDLAATTHPARLRLAVEHGIVEGRFTIAQLGAGLGRVRRRGKPGVRRLADVLDDLGPGNLARSELERLVDRVLRRAGLPEACHEHPLPNERGRTGFVDRCWPAVKLIVEADGRRWHSRRQQMAADADRTLEAQALGYQTTRLLWEHAHHDPDGTAELLRAIFEDRHRLLAGADLTNS